MSSDKPQFDPSKPFEKVDSGATSKPEFNPGMPFDSHSSDSAPSSLEVALRGASQGLTSNFGDEIAGGVKAGGDALLNLDPSLEHLKQKYQQFRDLERQRNASAEQANPSLYRTSDIVGAVGQGAALAAVGLPPIAGSVGKLAESAGAIEKLAQAAKIGAVMGGVGGLGASNADLTQGQFNQAGQDTGAGIGVGALTGGLFQGGVELAKGGAKLGGKAIASILNRYKPASIIPQAVNKGLEGVDLNDIEPHLNALEEGSKNLATKALGTKANLQNEYSEILSDAEQQGNKADLNGFLDKLEQLKKKYAGIKDPEVQKEIGVIDSTIKNYTEGMPDSEGVRAGGSPELAPKEAFDLQKLVGEKNNNVLQTNYAKQFGKEVDSNLGQEVQKAIPELPDVNKRYSAISNALDVLGLDSEDSLIKNVKTGDLELSPGALGRIQQFIKGNSEDSLSGNKAQQALNLVMDNLDAAGLNTDTLRKQMNLVGENFDLAKGLSSVKGHGLLSSIFNPSIKTIASAGNALGYAANKTGQAYEKYAPGLIGAAAQERAAEAQSTPVKQSFIPEQHSVSVTNQIQQGHNVYDTNDELLGSVAQRLSSMPGMDYKAKALQQAIKNNNQNQKNALIFSLMQNPSTRKLFEKGQ